MTLDTYVPPESNKHEMELQALPPMRLYLYGVVLVLLSVPPVCAQTALVRGFVTDQSDGQALQGVNVVLERDGQPPLGAATDTDGFFSIAGVPEGRYVLRASFVGYTPYTDTLSLQADELRTLTITLAPDETVLEEVVVESERTSGVANVTAGLQSIRPADIERVPAPGVTGDLVNYLSTLPGVVALGDRGGQLFIRGGEPSQNMVLIDGMLVYQPFHLLGFYSAFPASIISRADVYAGGYGARYGGRLSSVIDVTTREGNKRGMAGAVSVAPFVSTGRIEGPLIQDKLSVLASGRLSVIEQGAAHLVDQPLPFTFGDGFVKLHGQPRRHNRLSLSLLRTGDRGTIGEGTGEEPPDEVRWRNAGVGARYLYLPSTLPLHLEVLISASRLRTELGPDDDPTRTSETARINAEAHVTHYARFADVRWGLFARTLKLASNLGGLFQFNEDVEEFATEVGAYVAPRMEIGRAWTVTPGVRLHSFESRRKTFLEPRLRVVWEQGRHQISGAAGIYHQEVVGITDRRDAASVFTAWTATFGGVPEARHAILGYRVQPTSWLALSLEGYYNDLSELFVAEWTAFPRLTTGLQPADGRARGLDLRLEVRRPRFYGYVTYGLTSVTYTARQATLPLWYGVEELDFRPPHDRRHQVNALLSTSLYGFDVSLRWQLGSGLPFSRALGFDGFMIVNGDLDVFEEQGSRRVIYERPFNGLLPTYHRLDLSVERAFDFQQAQATLQLGLVNAYDRRNIFYLDVFTLRRVDQLPLVPILGLEVAFE